MASTVTFCTSDMDKIRDEVRALHERRATVLMQEVTELQKERDIASSRVQTLERTTLELQLENAALIQKCNESSNRTAILERSLLEERLTVTDLKAKLNSLEMTTISHSKAGENKFSTASLKLSSLAEFTAPSKSNISRNNTTHSSLGPADISNIPPTRKRYVLTNSQVKDNSSQTGENDLSCTDNFTFTEDDCIQAQISKMFSDKALHTEKLEQEGMKQENETNGGMCKVQFNAQCKVLESECKLLQTGLYEISKTVKESLQKFEDDLDFCKIIYTLHGSLSQENTVLENTRKKLNDSNKKCTELELHCKQLMATLSEKENELSRCLNWIQKYLSRHRTQFQVPDKHTGHNEKRHTLNT